MRFAYRDLRIKTNNMDEQPCPYGYESDGGQCFPIYKTFKQWVQDSGVGELIVNNSTEEITVDEFQDIVREAVNDTRLMNQIRDEFCSKVEESLLDLGRPYQNQFNIKMARYGS